MADSIDVLPQIATVPNVTYGDIASFLDDSAAGSTLVINRDHPLLPTISPLLEGLFLRVYLDGLSIVYDGFIPTRSLMPLLLARHLEKL